MLITLCGMYMLTTAWAATSTAAKAACIHGRLACALVKLCFTRIRSA